MGTLKRKEGESLTQFAERLACLYSGGNEKEAKKGRGQFFTPSAVADYMASLAEINKKKISILDPGAGVGTLSASLLDKAKGVKNISLSAYETDNGVLPYLQVFLKEAKKSLRISGINFDYKIIRKDFVRENSKVLINPEEKLDIIISNPPYFKLNKMDVEANEFKDIISGQPNIYFLFMAISSQLLNDSGQMIFITPRSFCSGLYYNKFRQWLIQRVSLSNIHIFDSRKHLFRTEKVLQENVITRFVKSDIGKIRITTTTDGDFSTRKSMDVKKKDVIYESNGFTFFRIPSNKEQLDAIRKLDKLPCNFYNLGLKVSTGKVVAFRNRQYLEKDMNNDSVPLLWMHNITNGKVQWPKSKGNKELAIKNIPETRKLLLDAGNYLVLKRFTTKEQKRRFETGIISKEDFAGYGYFALDNMVNYIHHPSQSLTKAQIKGIAKYLRFPSVELYFRALNGHTQVNANEVYALPSPDLKEFEDLGKGLKNLGDNSIVREIM